MAIPLLLVRPDGSVHQASAAAEELLGASDGRSCCDYVRARDPQGAAACTARCAIRLLREGGRGREVRRARIRSRDRRLVCTPMGDMLAVTILPEAAGTPHPHDALTAREREVLELVAEGLTTSSIARRLRIQPATVRTHVEHAREKLGARTRAEAVARALQSGQLVNGL